MTAYAVGQLEAVSVGADIVAYLERIDAMLAPFQGRFVIHGGRRHTLEGNGRGDLVVIAFPDLDSAKAWYASPAYQAILPLRTRNATSNVYLIEGVGLDHRATDVLKQVTG
jgi:uncharacterized protein (DUF1330 family)